VFPSDFGSIAWEALLVAGVLMFIARPVATYICTLPFRFTLRESTLLGWAGLRGAVPIVLATFPVIDQVPNADPFFNIVFFVVLTSTLIQGVTFEPLAKALRLTTEEPAIPRPLVEVGTIRRLGAEVLEFPVSAGDAVVGKLVNQLMLPRDALVNVIVRGDQALLPRGSTTIEAGDRLHILVRQPVRAEVEGLFERWREGPIGEEEALVMPLTGRQAIFSVRPWRDDMGDPGRPEAIDGVMVVRSMRVRRGEPGALVLLEDGRFAVTGDGLVAAGGPRQLFRYCRERIRRAEDPASVAWWQEVAGVISQRAMK
jgi:cell volume regulation protein A